MKKFLINVMTIWEKVSNIIKKINSELIYNKIYLKAEKRFNIEESFQCFCLPKIFLIQFTEKIFWFFGLWKFLLK